MPETSLPRGARKDATHNRVQILASAERAFSSHGIEASMDAIGKDAGVGPGTLYRHFPSKEALLAALLEAHYESLEAKRQAIASEEIDADKKLALWIDALGEWMVTYDGLPEPLRAAWSEVHSPLSPTCKHVVEQTDLFLGFAQREGKVRQDLRGRDIFLVALAIAWATGTTAADGETRHALRDILQSGWAAS